MIQDASSSQNGIVVSGGSGNEVMQNLVDNRPHNGILNVSSFMNEYDDNDIFARDNGLSVQPAIKMAIYFFILMGVQ